VITDIVGISMATADPEMKKADMYMPEEDAPIIWIHTRTNIVGQGRILLEEIESIYKELGKHRIRIILMPIQHDERTTNYHTDIYEIADVMIKVKDLGRRLEIDPKMALAKPWFPMGKANHTLSLSCSTGGDSHQHGVGSNPPPPPPPPASINTRIEYSL